MSKADAQMKIRLPEALKADIEEAAATHGRSMNAEIVGRLENKRGKWEDLIDFLRQEVVDLKMQIEGIKKEREEQHAQALEYAKRGSDVLAGAILQMDIRWTNNRLFEAESRLRRIERVLRE